jgi:hypothetical protein
MEPRGCNQWQSTANRLSAEAAKQAKSVAIGCHRLLETFHGKEGVDGSSPSEGSYESPATRGVSFFFRATRVGAISLDEFVNVSCWIAHVQTQPRFINDFVPYRRTPFRR